MTSAYSKEKTELIKEAHMKYFPIFPVYGKHSFNDCFTIIDNNLIFWYNSLDNSTRILKKKLN